MSSQNSKGNDWVWVTHFLGIFFAVMCMGLVIYCVVGVDNIDVAKATMGFSSAILGVILGFYFNRERLTKESKEKDYFSSEALDIYSRYVKLQAIVDVVHQEIEEEPEE